MNFSNSSFQNITTETEWFGILYQTNQSFIPEVKTTTTFTELDGEDTGTHNKIFSIIFAGLLSCVLMCLCCCITLNVFNKYEERRYYTDRDYFSNYDSSNSSEDEDNNSIISFTFQQEFRFNRIKETSLEPLRDIKLEETPLNEIVLAPGEDNLESTQISCSICLEKIDIRGSSPQKVIQLSCGHIYHQDCISNWYFGGVTSVSSCPLCRERIDHVTINLDNI